MCMCESVHELVCFAHICVWLFLHRSAFVLARVPACVCMPFGTTLSVWEYAAAFFNFKDAGTLCCVRLHADRLSLMNNYLQQCKTNPLIMMRCRATFQHDSPWSLLCSTLICVSQSCLQINNSATFLSAPSGMLSCGLLTSNSRCFTGEHFSRADACICLVF